MSVKFYSSIRSSSSFSVSPLSHSQELFVEYIRDEAQEVAEQLMTSDPLTTSNHEDILKKFCLEKEITSEQNNFVKTGQHKTDGICDPKELFQFKTPETKLGFCVCDQGNYSLREGSGTSKVDPEHKCTAGQHNAFDKKITQALANLHFLEWDGQTRRVNQGQ